MLKMINKSKIPFIPQLTKFDCGTSCLAMIMAYYGAEYPLEEINEKAGLSRNGLNVKDLIDIAKAFKFESKAFKFDKVEYIRSFPDFPVIALTFENHYIVISGFNSNVYEILDPELGRLKLREKELEKKLSNVFIQLTPMDSLKKRKKKSTMAVIIDLFNSYSFLIMAILFALITQIVTLAIPQLTQFVIDVVIAEKMLSLLFNVVMGASIIVLLYGILNYLRSYFINKMALSLSINMNKQLIMKLFKLPLSFFELRASGEIVSRIGNANSIVDPIAQVSSTLMIDILSIVVIGIAMFSKSIVLSFVAIFFAVFQSIITIWGIGKMRNLYSNEYSAIEKTQSYLYEMLTNMYIVKSTGLENSILNKWEAYFSKEIDVSIAKRNFSNLIESIMQIARISPAIVLLLVGSISVVNNQLTIGELMAFSSLSALFLTPFNSIIGSIQNINQIQASIERVREILFTKTAEKKSKSDNEIYSIESIKLDGVSFSYSKSGEVTLSDINFEIQKGEKIAIVGKSGSGKTTLVKLLLGLYEEDYKGNIMINDINMNDVDTQSFRKQIGVVYQDSFFFDETIENNVDFTNEYTLNEISTVCELACVRQDIEKMPLKYQTMIGEFGKNISGGQKQRLSIARALMRNPSLLILDEATHQIDAPTEKKITQNLKSKKITQIVITHRLQNIIDSDQIIVIDESKIKGIGLHEELLVNNLVYRELWDSQNSL